MYCSGRRGTRRSSRVQQTRSPRPIKREKPSVRRWLNDNAYDLPEILRLALAAQDELREQLIEIFEQHLAAEDPQPASSVPTSSASASVYIDPRLRELWDPTVQPCEEFEEEDLVCAPSPAKGPGHSEWQAQNPCL